MAGMYRQPLLVIVLYALFACACAGPPADSGELGQRLAALETRIEQAESLRAIKRLQYAYGHYVEFGLWNDFADLFAADAVAHYPAGELDRDAIRALFFDQVGGGQLGLVEGRLYPHFVLQPVVTLDPGGQSARGRWHVLTLLGGYGGNATWVDGVYENDYVREDGVWKISELRTYTVFSGAYDSGWTNSRPPPATDSAACENYLFRDCSIAFHYGPDRPGTPLAVPTAEAAVAPTAETTGAVTAETTGAVAAAAVDLASLGRQSSDLAQRVTRLLDEDAVRNLQHAYGYYVDRKRWDDVAALFADDATLELGLQGVYRGRSSIRRALDQFGPAGLAPGELNDHLQLETVVTIAPDGQTARARGIDFALVGWPVDGGYRSEWREAVFENVYRKDDGIWRIATMHLYPRFATDYAQGWAQDAQAAPGPSAAFPPDAPPTVVHGVYPAFHIPPFHFRNPVTGALPDYPTGTQAADLPPVSAPSSGIASTADANVSADTIAADLSAIERQLERAIAYDAVENLANAYNFYLDEFDGAAAAELFTDDAAVRVINADVAGGRAGILAAIEGPRAPDARVRPAGFIAIHQTLQPIVEVSADGRSARIWLRLFGSSGRRGEDGAWIAGIYAGEASNRDGVWALEQMDLYLNWAADYTTGWASAAPYAQIDGVPFGFDVAARD